MKTRDIAVYLGFAVVVAIGLGLVQTANALKAKRMLVEVQAQQVAADEREQRILDWIVERNPEASIKDFSGLPRMLLQQTREAGIDYRIVLALIDKESQFNPRAVGTSGEIGLMQILPSTAAPIAKALGITWSPPVKKSGAVGYLSYGTLGDTRSNVRIGLAYLKDQVNRFGQSPEALRAYNRGEAAALEHRPADRYAEDVAFKVVSLVTRFPQ